MHWRKIVDSSKDLLNFCNSCISGESLKERHRVQLNWRSHVNVDKSQKEGEGGSDLHCWSKTVSKKRGAWTQCPNFSDSQQTRQNECCP